MTTAKTIAALLALATGAAAPADPQYSIDWHTIDGGGGTSTGGVYTLSGTIGQHDAGPALSGGSYTVTGGFWAGVESGQGACNPADIAEPFGLLDLGDINAFVSGFTTQDGIADLNDDGLFDLSDVNTFVSSFLAGCP